MGQGDISCLFRYMPFASSVKFSVSGSVQHCRSGSMQHDLPDFPWCLGFSLGSSCGKQATWLGNSAHLFSQSRLQVLQVSENSRKLWYRGTPLRWRQKAEQKYNLKTLVIFNLVSWLSFWKVGEPKRVHKLFWRTWVCQIWIDRYTDIAV